MKLLFDGAGIALGEFGVSGCASFGREEFLGALKKKKISVKRFNHWTEIKNPAPLVVIGTAKNRRVQILLENAGVDYRGAGPESLFVKWCEIPGGRVLLIAGSDETGLMYNLLEMARLVEKDGVDALNNAADLSESPRNAVRCVDRYVVGHLDDEWLKSEEFWRYLLARMARARFNRFCLILGFDTAYMSPPYPFFVETPGFPKVKVEGLSEEARKENLAALRKLGALCHEYGMKFILATWQQRPWTAIQEQLVTGLPEDEEGLSDYCYGGIKDLLRAVPEVDIVQFRVNHESGVGNQVSAEDFWNRCADAVADVASETGRPLILDLRAKGLTESMIAHAFSRGLPVEVPTKYWCEHAALPYHLSVMRSEELARLDNFNHSRRYSYANMLRKPRFYDVIYRLWNYGSTNLFLWGDADYARRFSLSCGLSGSAGFQINTPLSLKYGYEQSHKARWDTFKKKELRYGKWEDERFWMWYTAFGRLGYNPDTNPSVWRDEFAVHFGAAGESLEKALAAASKIVPFVTTVHMPVHPSLRYWTEMSTGWALFAENNLYKPKNYDPAAGVTYGSAEPSDHGLFYGIDEYAADFRAGKLAGKYSPLQSALWLEGMASETERQLSAAAAAPESAEYLALRIDLSMLCDFARYHAAKIRSACALAFWKLNKKDAFLSDALLLLDEAIGHWKALAEKGRENYYHDLDFSSAGTLTRRGTWGDLTKELLADRETLVSLLGSTKTGAAAELSAAYIPGPLPVETSSISAVFPERAKAGAPLKIEAAFPSFGEVKAPPVLHYRHTNQNEGLFKTLKMTRSAGVVYAATIPAKYVTAEWDLQVYITVQGNDGACVMYPGIYHPAYPYPYHVISVGEI